MFLSRRICNLSTKFKQVYNKNLLISNTVSTMALLGAGDVFAQCVEYKIKTSMTLNAAPIQSNLSTTASNIVKQRNQIIKNNKGINMAKTNETFKSLRNTSFFDHFDYNRSVKIALIGTAMGPFGHYWYNLLDKILPSCTLAIISLKVCLDQLISAPLLNVFYIFGSNGLDGKNLEECCEIFNDKFMTIYAVSFNFWKFR
jgi:hypothetical protein